MSRDSDTTSDDRAPPGVYEVTFGFEAGPEDEAFHTAFIIDMGGRREAFGGSRAITVPEDELMRAVLMMLAGAWRADAVFEHEPGRGVLSFRRICLNPLPEGASLPPEQLWRPIWSVEVTYDEPNGRPWDDHWRFGAVPSPLHLARAVLEMAERFFEGRAPSEALVALRGAVRQAEAQAR